MFVSSYLSHLQANPIEYRRPVNQCVDSSTLSIFFTDLEIVVKETRFDICGLGFRVFPSSLVLAQVLNLVPAIVKNRKLLELGSGLGGQF